MVHMHKGLYPGDEETFPVSGIDLRHDSYMQDRENRAVTFHDKAHTGTTHDHTCVTVRTTSGRTPAHRRDTSEALVVCVLVPGANLLYTGIPGHIPDNHMWIDGMIAAFGCGLVVLGQLVL